MRLPAIVLCGLCLLAFAPDARAQLSPGGVFNALTSPIRGAIGALHGARPRHRSARRAAKRTYTAQQRKAPAAAASATTVASAPSAEASPSANAAATDETKPEIVKAEATKAGEPKAYWPGAHEDLIGYIFWPRDYGDKLWAHGFGEIMSTVLVPALTRTASVDGAADAPSPTDAAKLCGPDGGGEPDGRIAETLRAMTGDAPPTDAQRNAFKALQTALDEATKAVRAACVDIVHAPAAARMQTMLDRLWAIRVAGYLVREPLKQFYETLSSEQKEKFEQGVAAANALDVCTAASTARIPVSLLERTIRPDAAQRKSLAALERKVEQASASVRASCPFRPPASPVARLDAALDRVDAIAYAAGQLMPAFGDFYESLRDDQRVKLSEPAR